MANFGVCYWLGAGSILLMIGSMIFYRKLKGVIFRNRQISQYLKLDKIQVDSIIS